MATNTAFILGYTGATGKALVKELVTDDFFTKIVLVGRRKSAMPEGADDRFVCHFNLFDFKRFVILYTSIQHEIGITLLDVDFL